MKCAIFVTAILCAILITGCVNAGSPPNDEVGYTDAQNHANFHYIISGTDFPVDDVGHNYTLHGENLTYDEMIKLFFYVSPWAWGDIKNFFLNYCHQNQSVCNYNTVAEKISLFESSLTRNMPEESKKKFDSIMADKALELELMF